MKYSFSSKEIESIEKIKKRFPEVEAATLPVLWLAQRKFGHTNEHVQELVANTLDLPHAHVHGVATFYTQYYKSPKGKYVLDICTCLSCQLCGAYSILDLVRKKLGIESGETTKDNVFSLQEVECLGACGYAPVLQLNNTTYIHNLTPQKLDQLIEQLKQQKTPEFESIEMRYIGRNT